MEFCCEQIKISGLSICFCHYLWQLSHSCNQHNVLKVYLLHIRMTFYWTLWKPFAFQTLLGVQSAWKRVQANDTVIALLWFSSWLMFVTLDFSSAHKMWNAFFFTMWVMFFDDPDKLSAYLKSAVEPWFRTVLKVGKKRGGGSSLTLCVTQWLREESLAFLASCSFCVKVLSQLFFSSHFWRKMLWN